MKKEMMRKPLKTMELIVELMVMEQIVVLKKA
jgi:hypothetical protein